jgi:molybdopterin-guanine dinucleotide biosynthesis protein A
MPNRISCWPTRDASGNVGAMSGPSTTTPAPQRPWGLILAGGESARMGTDKGALLHDGHTWAARAAAALDGLCDVVIVAGHGRGAPLHLRRVDDLEGVSGPVAGLGAGFAAARDGGAAGVVVVPVDMPRLRLEPLAALWAQARVCDDVTVFADVDGPQPLPAALSARGVDEALRRIALGARSLRAALDLGAATALDAAPWKGALRSANSLKEMEFLSPSRGKPSE